MKLLAKHFPENGSAVSGCNALPLQYLIRMKII